MFSLIFYWLLTDEATEIFLGILYEHFLGIALIFFFKNNKLLSKQVCE